MQTKDIIRVRFFSDWGSSESLAVVLKLAFGEQLVNNGIEIVSDESYTHVVLLNHVTPALHVPRERVVGLAVEPMELLGRRLNVNYLMQHVGLYVIGKPCGLPPPCLVNYAFQLEWRPEWYSRVGQPKSKLISLPLSDKQWLPGHAYRHQLAAALMTTDLPVDLWGRGASIYKDPRSKGEFVNSEPYAAYRFTIAIENTQSEHYISEKYTNPLECNTVTLYLGASCIEQHFGTGCCLALTGQVDKDVQMITQVCNEPDRFQLSLEKPLYELKEGKASLLHFLKQRWNAD